MLSNLSLNFQTAPWLVLEIKMSKFTWAQLMKWEVEAAKRRVPANINGLLHRHLLPNNRRWFAQTVFWERNGEKTIAGHRATLRFGCIFFMTLCVYQLWRVPIWGYIELMEHHNNNYDNLVYDKLSTRITPYHYPAGFP